MLAFLAKSRRCVGAVVVLLFVVAGAHADVLDMPAGQTSLTLTAPIGDLGNAPDTTIAVNKNIGLWANLGQVNYVYQMGTYDVTCAQYCQFLNAKLPNITDTTPANTSAGIFLPSDTYGLYNPAMNDYGTDDFPYGGANNTGGINYDPNATAGQHFYVAPGRANWPVGPTSTLNAMRFSNWLTNGQGNGDTESGTYLITGGSQGGGAVPGGAGYGQAAKAGPRSQWSAVTAANNGHYVLPTQNEWYKAAYYKAGGTNSGYWIYPTQFGVWGNGTPPSSSTANFGGNVGSMTDVGSYPYPSAYGTYDQGGDALQWTETPAWFHPGQTVVAGGSWAIPATSMASYGWVEHNGVGLDYMSFRVAFIPAPEPGGWAMLTVVAITALLLWWPKIASLCVRVKFFR
jgi:formylglycine-generating enzyme